MNRLSAALRTLFLFHPTLVFVVLYVLSCLILLNPTIHGSDGHGNYAYLRSVLFDGDLDFRNDYALFDRITDNTFEFHKIPEETATGLPGNRYGIGSSVLWAPFVIPVRMVGALSERDETGMEPQYVWAVGIGSAVWTGLGLLLLLTICRTVWGPLTGWAAIAAALMLSPLPFYCFFHTSMSHAAAFFSTTGLLASAITALRRLDRKFFVTMGIFAGLSIMIRSQDAAVVFALFAWIGLVAVQKTAGAEQIAARRLAGGLVIATAVSLLVFVPQMIVWQVLYGSPFSGPAPYLRYGEFSLFKPVHALESLFSSNHGLFFWHPLLALGLVGLIVDLRKKRPASFVFLLAVAATWYLVSCWQVWFAGASFGNRFFLSVLASFAAGWAALAGRSRQRWQHIVIWALIFLGGLWNAGVMVQYGTGLIPRQGEIPPSVILENQFTKVPYLLAEKLKQAVQRTPLAEPNRNKT